MYTSARTGARRGSWYGACNGEAMIIPPLPPSGRPAPAVPAAPSASAFAATLAAALPQQNVPEPGMICRALEAERPLAIAGAAARGFLLGGPIGAAVGGGIAALGPFFHLPLPAGDGVTGDQSIIQRTASTLAAYAPSTSGKV